MASTVASAVLSNTVTFSLVIATASSPEFHAKHKNKIDITYSSSSSRQFAIIGLSLLLIGICILSAVIIKLSRSGSREVNHDISIVQERVPILDQSIIDRSFYIRVFPSHQRILLNNDDPSTVMTAVTVVSPSSILNEKACHPSTRNEKPIPLLSRRHSFVGFTRLGKLWSRDSLPCNSPSPSLHDPRMTSLNDRAIHSLSSTRSCALRIHNTERQESRDELCSICLCEYELDDQIRVLPCEHEYHAECIDIWLCSKSTECPLCKRELLNDICTLPSDRS